MESVHNRNLSSSDISNHLRNEERIELRTILHVLTIVHHLLLESLDTADANTEDHTNAVLVDCLQIHATVFHGLNGGNHSELRIAVHLAGFLAIKVIVHIEILNLAGKLCLKQGCIEKCNGCSTAYAVDEVLPRLFWRITYRRHGTKARYDYSF